MKQTIALIILFLVGCTAVPDAEISTAVPTRTVAPTAETTAVSTQTPFPQPSPSPTTVPAAPTETATAILLPQITSQTMSNVEYGVTWSIPVEWVEITEQWPLPDPDTVYWDVWANQPEAAAPLTLPPASLAEGVLVATMQIAPGPETPPAETTATIAWGQTVYQREMEGEAASPYAWRWEVTAVRSPYHYILTFGCIPPVSMDQEGGDFCRNFWDSVSFGFGLCVTAASSTPEATFWQTITDSWYGYSFEIPATWVAAPAVSGDTLTLLSHPVHQQPIVGCPIPEGFMKVDFFANPQLDPDTAAAFTAISPLKGHPAWIRQLEDGEGGNFLAKSREVLIQGTQNRYLLVFYCSPDWSEQCEAVYSHLVESLSIE